MLSRKDAKYAKKGTLSFRPKGEIFLRSLALARDDGPLPVTLASFAALGESQLFPYPEYIERFERFEPSNVFSSVT
jgi:hypothetical protein